MNYWEFRPTALVERLDELLQKGVTEIVSFVPWQAVEADISHLLTRFLQAAAERRIVVHLIVSPELGIAFPNSGIPRDILAKPECLALDADHQPSVVLTAPNSHALPSLLSSEFLKRYQSYLQRVDHFLLDALKRGGAEVLDGVRLIQTGSYWKYYRTARFATVAAFDGPVGDFSASAGIQFRNRVEEFFTKPEFCEPSPASANRWKLKSLEEVNRRWFLQQSEDQFRLRASQFFGRKSLSLPVEQVELFSPEVDPSYHYSKMLSHLAGAKADFSKFASFVDEAARRRSQVGGVPASPWIHWSSTGAFSSLSAQEKQFLILKGLLLLASQSGGVLVDAEDWLSLSESFRRRTESLARSLVQGDYRLRQRAFYWNSHLWSSGGGLWNELSSRLGSLARMISSDHLLRGDAGQDADLLVVDPTVVLTRDILVHLLTWTRGGRVTAIPRSLLYTERARAELLRILQSVGGTRRMDLHVGIPFELHSMGEGRLVVYDAHALEKSESPEAHRQFIQSLMGLAEIKNPCTMSDPRLQVIGLERRGGGQGVFILNSQTRMLDSDVHFPNEVMVEDLGQRLQQESSESDPSGSGFSARRFHLEIPPCGVLPLQVLDTQWENELERRQAARVADEMRRSVESVGEPWNGVQSGELPWN